MENEIQPNSPPIQPIPQAPVSPTTNWKKIILFILLGMVVVAVSVFVGIQIGRNQITNQQPIVGQPTISPTQTEVNPTDLPTTNPITDWKTYADVIHNFSLKYPSDWIISNGNYLNGEKYVNLGTECLSIKISTYSTTSTLEKFIQQQGNTTENVSEMKGPKSDQFTDTLNKNMIESFSLGQHGSGQIDNIYLKNKQTVLYFRLSEFDIQELPTDQRQNHVCNFDKTSMFNQTLSTFKFTD